MSRRQKLRNRGAEASRASAEQQNSGEGLRFTLWTGVYGGVGLLSVGLGFFLLARGSINVAPVLLLVGFLIFFPLALVK